MKWVEFFKVYDSSKEMGESPLLMIKIIEDGSLEVGTLATRVTKEIPEAIEDIKMDEKVIKQYPFIKDLDIKDLKHFPENNIYGILIK